MPRMLMLTKYLPIPRHLNVRGIVNIRFRVALLPAAGKILADCNLLLRLVTTTGAPRRRWFMPKCRPRSPVPAVLMPTHAAVSGRFGPSNERAVLAGMLIGNIAMVVIGVGYLSYFFPDSISAGINATCVAVLWILFC